MSMYMRMYVCVCIHMYMYIYIALISILMMNKAVYIAVLHYTCNPYKVTPSSLKVF